MQKEIKKVYVISLCFDHEGCTIQSIWDNEVEAKAEFARLNKKTGDGYYVRDEMILNDRGQS